MLAYFCKYVPEELIQAFDTELVCMEPDASKSVFLLQSGSGRI